MNQLKEVRVKRGYELGSNHYVVEAKIKGQRVKIRQQANAKRKFTCIGAYKLHQEEYKVEYQNELKINLEICYKAVRNEDLEEEWKSYRESVTKFASKVYETVRYSGNKKHTLWWNTEIKVTIERKKKAWKKYVGSKSENN